MEIRQRADGGSVTSLLTPYSPPVRREASDAATVDICPPGPVGRRGETRGQRTKVTHNLEMQPGALRSLLPCCAECLQRLLSASRQLTCPLENTNTRAAPAAVIPQVKKVPSKAWNTELWPWSMLDTAVWREREGQLPAVPFGDECMF